jgi:MFS family permease
MTSALAWQRMTPATRLVGASLMSGLADGVRLTAFPLLVLALTSSPLWVSVTFAAGLVPSVLLGPVAGALADRHDRQRLLRAVTAARTVMLLVLAAAIAAGATPIMVVVVVAALFGAGEAFTDNTMAALVPSVVPRDRLDTINGRLVGVHILGNELVGPAIGSALFAVVAWLPFVSASGTLTIALVLIGGLSLLATPEPVAAATRADDSDSMLAGLRFVTGSEVLRRLILSTALLA